MEPWSRVLVKWPLVGSCPVAAPCPAVIGEQDRLLLAVRQRLLKAIPFRLLSALYYFRRCHEPPTLMHFHAITRRGVQPLLVGLVAWKLGPLLGQGRTSGRVLPEPVFLYGDDLAAELRFRRFLRWMSDVASELLSSDAAEARRMALDVYYAGLRGTPGLRGVLEPRIAARSSSYCVLRERGLDREFWESFSFVGKGQPWDHWYFHLVLGMDPDYQGGVRRSRREIEVDVGL